MDSIEFTGDVSTCRPLPGRVLIEIEPHPDHVGSIHVPQSAQEQKVGDVAMTARVIKVGYGVHYERGENGKLRRCFSPTYEELKPGDRVRFRPLMSEMVGIQKVVVLTDVRRIDAVIED